MSGQGLVFRQGRDVRGAGSTRTGDDNAYFGTEPLFRRAGFRVVRKPLKGRPHNWVARVTMRA